MNKYLVCPKNVYINDGFSEQLNATSVLHYTSIAMFVINSKANQGYNFGSCRCYQ